MNENIILFDESIEEFVEPSVEPSPSPEPQVIDYDLIEDAFYNALYRLDQEQQLRESLVVPDSDVVNFATGTDADMISGSVVAVPTSSAQQTTMYLLDIRNVLLIALLTYLVITLYSKIKNSLTHYYGKEE